MQRQVFNGKAAQPGVQCRRRQQDIHRHRCAVACASEHSGDTPGGANEFYANAGKAVRTLAEELPRAFETELTYDIYRDDVVLVDRLSIGGRAKVSRGKRAYARAFWRLRLHGRIFFRKVSAEVLRIWAPSEKTLCVRWQVQGQPRVISAFGVTTAVFDGISEFKLDTNGFIYEHRVDNVDWDVSRFRERLGYLQSALAPQQQQPVPAPPGAGDSPGFPRQRAQCLSNTDECTSTGGNGTHIESRNDAGESSSSKKHNNTDSNSSSGATSADQQHEGATEQAPARRALSKQEEAHLVSRLSKCQPCRDVILPAVEYECIPLLPYASTLLMQPLHQQRHAHDTTAGLIATDVTETCTAEKQHTDGANAAKNLAAAAAAH